MGLDMHLSKEKLYGSHIRPDIKGFEGCGSITARGEAIYWRKANANGDQIHNWFVENMQDGIDECQETWVPTDKLKELLERVGLVLDDHDRADSVLPTRDGFFSEMLITEKITFMIWKKQGMN